MRRLLPPPALAGACIALLASAPPAFGHAAFAGSDPAPGQRVAASPARVTLLFTEPLDGGLATADLRPAAGGPPLAATVATERRTRLVIVPRRPLGTGVYSVHWHTVSSDDGHALEGTFAFGVRAEARAAQALETGPFARAGAARMLARLALYATLLTLAAALLTPRLVRRPAGWPVPDAIAEDLGRAGAEPTGAAGARVEVAAARERGRRLTGDLAWLAVAAAVASALADAADAASGIVPSRLTSFLLGNVPGLARVLVVGALVVAALARERAPRLAGAAVVLALGAVAASGHAASADPRVPSILNDWLHLLSGAVWLGTIALLVLLWWPVLRFTSRATRVAVARRVLAPFGPVALGAFALAVTTGLVSLLTQLGRVSALWDTGYGRVLAVKIVLVGIIAAVSWGHALRLRPRLLAGDARAERRHWRLWRSEPWLALLVVAAVAALVAFPLPPRQLAETGTALASVCDPCPLPRPAPDELGVAGQAGSQVVAAWVRRTPAGVTGTVRALDSDGRPSRVPLDVPGGGARVCGEGCRRFALPARAAAVPVAVLERGRRYATSLPARWDARGTRRARAILARAEATMRSLTGVRELEHLTSGPGTAAVTEYRLRAPDRLAWHTGRWVRSVVVGPRQWLRTPAAPWQGSAYGSGLAFRTRSWFRWESYARTVRLLAERDRDGRRTAELALMDEGTPVWFRLTVDLRTHRVLREEMAARARFSRTTFDGFGRRFAIRPPAGVP
jgi:copper transport protein